MDPVFYWYIYYKLKRYCSAIKKPIEMGFKLIDIVTAPSLELLMIATLR
tara:strand:- start:45502 stop:45648 length:147 start_codon:yes stop_codon:yes gene_type:complete